MFGKMKFSLIALALGAILTLCSFATLSAHKLSASPDKSTKISCSGACHSHGQSASLQSEIKQDEEDDKEPTPPPAFWTQAPVNLLFLYTAPILGILWFIPKQRKILLSTQLRF